MSFMSTRQRQISTVEIGRGNSGPVRFSGRAKREASASRFFGRKLSEPFYFADNKPHESSQTWQVARAEFDLMMLNNAREHGVNVHEGARVLEVIFEGSRAVGVTLAEGDGQRQVFADVVIDAAGQSTMIQDRLGLREWDPVLKKAALWTYWKGAYRDTGKDEGATIVLQLDQKQGWFWYIPLADDMLSVGVVAPHEYLFKNRVPSSVLREPTSISCAG